MGDVKVLLREGVTEWLVKIPADEPVICAKCQSEIPIEKAHVVQFWVSMKTGIGAKFLCSECHEERMERRSWWQKRKIRREQKKRKVIAPDDNLQPIVEFGKGV